MFKAVADLADFWQTAVTTEAVLCVLCCQIDPWFQCRQEVTLVVTTPDCQ